MTNPITPPPELVQQWEEQFLARPTINGCFIQSYIAAKAAQWGADQELEACCKWLPKLPPWSANDLRKHRRPKPPSLKEQALLAIDTAVADDRLSADVASVVRRALEALDD